ncbi:MAG: hypothetical protein OJF62_001669 [Pseudolabrys sp.]|jgi:uncharacterized DUF497 family protein|nr:hypothetical protein [Pseudolabrys sp.]
MIEFDPVKDAANIKKHGISLARAADLVPAASVVDDRREATSCVRSASAVPIPRR